MIISHSRKYIFIHLEKCGGTTVESVLDRYLDINDLCVGSSKFGEAIQRIYFEKFGPDKVKDSFIWKHSTAEDAYRFVGKEKWESYKKIAVVRDPREIMASLYFFSRRICSDFELTDTEVLSRMFNDGWVEDISNWPFGAGFIIEYCRSLVENSGFDGFVKSVINKNYEYATPQVERLTVQERRKDGLGLEIDLVVDISQIQEKWNDLIVEIGGAEAAPNIPFLNSSERDRSINDLYSNKRTDSLVRKHFKIDYQTLPHITGVSWG